MKKTLRLAVLGATATVALSLASAALADFKPSIFVNNGASAGAAGVTMRYVTTTLHDPTAVLKYAVPKAYTVSTSGTAGTSLGTTSATFYAADQKTAVSGKGTLQVANASEFAGQATACTGSAVHTATWVASVTAGGTNFRLPVFVDTIASGPLASLSSASLTICFAAPDVPAGTPNRAALGARILSASFTSSAITTPAQGGTYRWRATATPYSPGRGLANSNATVEVQSLAVLPIGITLSAQRVTAGKVHFLGALSANGAGISGVFVDLLRSGKKVATLTTKRAGAFDAIGKLKGGGTFAARATQPDKDLGSGSCQATFRPPLSPTLIPCIDATLPGFSVVSKTVKV